MTGRVRAVVAAWLACACVLAVSCSPGQPATRGVAASRGFEVAPLEGGGLAIEGRQIALLVGSDDYTHWPDLKNAVSDARNVAADLSEVYNFDRVELLTNPTEAELRRRMRALANGEDAHAGEVLVGGNVGPLTEKDSLLVFVSGHGYLDSIGSGDSAVKEGHIVTVDAPAPEGMVDAGYSFTHDSFLKLADAMPARRVLVVLDICHGGTTLMTRGGDEGVATTAELIERTSRYKARVLITSVGVGTASDGTPGTFSPFTRRLLGVLRKGKGATSGALTHADLFAGLQAAKNQGDLPMWGTFGAHEPGGLFVMARRAASSELMSRCGGDASACYYEGLSSPPAEANALFGLACGGGEMRACVALGTHHERGVGAPEDAHEANALFGRACDAGEWSGCFGLGVNHERGRGVEKDLERANGFYEKACAGGFMKGCTHLGYNTESGRGAPQDAREANALYRRACLGGDTRGCSNLGHNLEHGVGAPRDIAKADAFYMHACDGGDARGCASLGLDLGNSRGTAYSKRDLIRLQGEACEAGNMKGCLRFGRARQLGEHVERDLEEARELFERACEAGEPEACTRLAELGERAPTRP